MNYSITDPTNNCVMIQQVNHDTPAVGGLRSLRWEPWWGPFWGLVEPCWATWLSQKEGLVFFIASLFWSDSDKTGTRVRAGSSCLWVGGLWDHELHLEVQRAVCCPVVALLLPVAACCCLLLPLPIACCLVAALRLPCRCLVATSVSSLTLLVCWWLASLH